jgi:hypothetical protein
MKVLKFSDWRVDELIGTALAFAVFFSVILPNAVDVPGINVGETVEGVESGGFQWIRILETGYAVVKVTSLPMVPMTVYDDAGEPLAVSANGDPLVLSTYSDYWFWIKADSDSRVKFLVEYIQPEPVSDEGVSSFLSSAEMADIWTFTALEEGRWNFALRGTDDIADLDLELYGDGNSLWAGSYGASSTEKLSMGLLKGESLQIVVSRYNKGGDGGYNLEIVRTGEMDVLSGSIEGDAISGNVHRYKLLPSDVEAMVELTFENEGDLDMSILGADGQALYSSSTYLYSEALLVPAGNLPMVVEVHAFDVGVDLPEFPYRLKVVYPSDSVRLSIPQNMETEFGQSALSRFIAPSTGFYTISGVFDKFRDGDIRVFNDYGESAVLMMTERGDERLSISAQRGDTLWISPGFLNPSRGGACAVSVENTDADTVTGITRGRIDDTTLPQKFYTVYGEAGSTLVIELRGDQSDFDLDMLVSGPGYVLQAEGGQSNADNAADESVALYCEQDAVYSVTVYAYSRNGQGTFTIKTESIPSETLASGDPATPETWAVVCGISGYESLVDILARASMDAIEFYRFLRDNQNIDPDHIILLVDAEARADAFTAALNSISDRADANDRMFVFFSGHGSQEAPGSGGAEEPDGVNEVLCFYDGDISDDNIRSTLSGFPGSVYLFLDACNSGGFVNDFSENDNMLILTAAREDRSVSERILTPILLEASRGAADSNGNGVITSGELVNYVDEMLARICPVCDAVVNEGMAECSECGTVLKGEYRIPRPEQGLFMSPDEPVWD